MDIENRPYVRNLLQGMIGVRDREKERRNSLDTPAGRVVSGQEPIVNVGAAIERSEMEYEEGNESNWAAAQQYLRDKGVIIVQNTPDQDGLYSAMRFTNSAVVDIAKKLVK